jgi:hypothetical protein
VEGTPEAKASEKSWPVPVRLTVCVVPATPPLLSVMVRVAVSEPPAVGVKVTLIVQLAPAATLLPQLLVWAKFPLLVMLATARAMFPVLDSVTACALLVEFTRSAAKVRAVGETLATGEVPVPVRLTDWMLPVTPLLLSVRVRVPLRVPFAVGVKVTLIVQLPPPAATLEPQLLVWLKSPLMAMLAMVSTAVPVLLRVTACAVLVVPSN